MHIGKAKAQNAYRKSKSDKMHIGKAKAQNAYRKTKATECI
jgi:hypothetical protein